MALFNIFDGYHVSDFRYERYLTYYKTGKESGFNYHLENIMKIVKIVKKFGIVISAVLFAAGVCQAADTTASGQIKVAVVNVQQVLQQSPRVVELSKKLESQFSVRRTKINDQQKAIQDEMDKLHKESLTMNQKEKDTAQKKIAGEKADLVKQVVAYQQDLQKEQNKIMQGILNDLNGIVSNIAKKHAYGLVLDSQAVIYATDGNDITKDVAKEFNSQS